MTDAEGGYYSVDFKLPKELKPLLEADRLIVNQAPIPKRVGRYNVLNHYEVLANSPSRNWEFVIKFEEESSFRCRLFCSNYRPFIMRGVTEFETIMMLRRPLRCPANFCYCCPYELRVEAPPGTHFGSIVQAPACLANRFYLKDDTGQAKLKIEGPWFARHCCLDMYFKIYSMTGGRSIGRIVRQWRDGHDTFHLAFPRDLHVHMKTLLMTSTILIDFIYFGSH
ncbi:unnamed protein product [Calicophoron daubneyi]|uniref:Phospholipid scramblase n=1 Tax=Calicophoron daubneyi TaxID=300641 RepID=A0AAV2T5R8_CALDB